MERRFLLVDASVLPDVFIKVLKAKELLASGAVRNISSAVRQAGLSRSAFYKYKDCVFDARNSRKVITVLATLLDETGALQALLAGISAAGGSVVTINQSTPESGAAQVAVSVRTDTMQMSVEEMLQKLRRQRTVVEIRQGVCRGRSKSALKRKGTKGPMAKIAILGFGTVGGGVLEVLRRNAASVSRRAGQPVEGKYILDIRDFSKHPDAALFVDNIDTILADPEIKVVVETIGGTKFAYPYVR